MVEPVVGLGFVVGRASGGRNGDDEVDGNGNEAYKKIKQREESWLST